MTRDSRIASTAARAALALAVLAAALTGGIATVASAAVRGSRLQGIDVSHYQGTINWNSVHGAGIKFVFAKSTEGQTFNDPNYSTYRAGAKANGLVFGAYHFAEPDTSSNDAVIEADHMVSFAAPARGDLIPVLDLEVSNGLSVSTLQTWVWSWLGEVQKKLGVKAIIYTSPSFWSTYMGNSTAYAAAGYTLLWIANWGVSKPSVPASNWDGHGWTFWQYTDCGNVSGVSGCVDRDRYHGTDLTRVEMP